MRHREHQRQWRLRNKIYDAYDHLKRSARKRNILIEITLEEFTAWCQGNNYHELRGVGPGKMSIDRPKPWIRSYRLDNMEMKEFCQNCSEGADYRWGKEGSPPMIETDVEF